MLWREAILSVAADLLRAFGPEAPPWQPLDARWDPLSPAPPDELVNLEVAMVPDGAEAYAVLSPPPARDGGATLLVSFGNNETSRRYEVAVPVFVAPVWCLTEFASQLQDHIWESTEAWGLPLPRCPEHLSAPLVPKDVEGDSVWWCERCSYSRPLLDPAPA